MRSATIFPVSSHWEAGNEAGRKIPSVAQKLLSTSWNSWNHDPTNYVYQLLLIFPLLAKTRMSWMCINQKKRFWMGWNHPGCKNQLLWLQGWGVACHSLDTLGTDPHCFLWLPELPASIDFVTLDFCRLANGTSPIKDLNWTLLRSFEALWQCPVYGQFDSLKHP